MIYTKTKVIYPPCSSPAERAFMSVPTLQGAFEPRSARALASVCSTFNAVLDDPALWRRYLAQELNQHRWAIQHPVDQQAVGEADITARPYKEIYRGFRIIDIEYGPNVLQAPRDMGQQKAVERAQRFIDIHFKGLRDEINTRNFLYAPQHPLADELGWRAIKACMIASVCGAVSLYTGTLACTGACATQESTAALYGERGVNMATFIGTKIGRVIAFGGVSLFIGVGAMVHVFVSVCSALTSYQSYYVNRKAQDHWVAAAEMRVHLLKFKTRIAVDRARIRNPNASLNDIRSNGISGQQTEPRN